MPDLNLANQLRSELDLAGYYPELVAGVIDIALADEPVVSYLVHPETTFDETEVFRHLTALVLTPSRLVVAHVDDGPGPDGRALRAGDDRVRAAARGPLRLPHPRRERPGACPRHAHPGAHRRGELGHRATASTSSPPTAATPSARPTTATPAPSPPTTLVIRVSAQAEGADAAQRRPRLRPRPLRRHGRRARPARDPRVPAAGHRRPAPACRHARARSTPSGSPPRSPRPPEQRRPRRPRPARGAQGLRRPRRRARLRMLAERGGHAPFLRALLPDARTLTQHLPVHHRGRPHGPGHRRAARRDRHARLLGARPRQRRRAEPAPLGQATAEPARVAAAPHPLRAARRAARRRGGAARSSASARRASSAPG